MTNQDRSPQQKTALDTELLRLLQTLKTDYTSYCRLLKLTLDASGRADNEKLLHYREQEQALFGRIFSTEQTYRDLLKQTDRTAAGSASLNAEAQSIGALRSQAIELIANTQDVLGVQSRKIQADLAAVRSTLKKMQGGRVQTVTDPLYIDINT